MHTKYVDVEEKKGTASLKSQMLWELYQASGNDVVSTFAKWRAIYTSTSTAASTSITGVSNWVDDYSGTFSIDTSASFYDGFVVQARHFHARDLLRCTMKSNLLIKTADRTRRLQHQYLTEQEAKARRTLRDMLTEAEWRRYLTNGFIMVKGASGQWYQIFGTNRDRVRVYRDNKPTHSICIHTDETCPPTDHVLNLKLMVEINEPSIWRAGNVAEIYPDVTSQTQHATLVDAYRNIKNRKIATLVA